MNKTLLQSIQSRGHWRINFRPVTVAALDSLSLESCLVAVQQAAVSLRGWDYPHIPHQNGHDSSLDRVGSYIEGSVDWMSHRELWRMYRSSQFLHYRALHEDWPERDQWGEMSPRARIERPQGPLLGVKTNAWLLAEIFEFLARLHQRAHLYVDGAEVIIELRNGTENLERMLYVEDPGRAGFSRSRRNKAPVLQYRMSVSAGSIIEPRKLATDAALFFYDKFGWTPTADQVAFSINSLYELK